MNSPSHLDDQGRAKMVDVGDKSVTRRVAAASCRIEMSPETVHAVTEGEIPKGDVIATARLAGIMAAKRVPDLIPLCHIVNIASADVQFNVIDERTIRVDSRVTSMDRTGVEMEALTAATVAALTFYDMCKSIDRMIEITAVRLEEKSGGKSGVFDRKEES